MAEKAHPVKHWSLLFSVCQDQEAEISRDLGSVRTAGAAHFHQQQKSQTIPLTIWVKPPIVRFLVYERILQQVYWPHLYHPFKPKAMGVREDAPYQ